MLTGSDLYKYIQNGVDQEYSGFLDEIKGNRLIREAEIRVAEQKYQDPDNQKTADDTSPLLLLDQSLTVRTNRVRTNALPISGFVVVGTVATITLEEEHQLQVGDSFTLSNTQGFTPVLDGVYTVTAVTTTLIVECTVPAVVGTWTPNTGDIKHDYMFSDMFHPFAIKTTFVDSEQSMVNTLSLTGNPYIGFTGKEKYRTGSLVRITGSLGTPGLDADHYLKQRNRKTFYLYQDKALLTPSVVTGSYLGAGLVREVISEWATKLVSDRRIAPSSQGTVYQPKFGINNNGLDMYPKDNVCESVSIDYMRRPYVEILTTDTTKNLEDYYEFKYLMRIKDTAVTMWEIRMRERQQAQLTVADGNLNQ